MAEPSWWIHQLDAHADRLYSHVPHGFAWVEPKELEECIQLIDVARLAAFRLTTGDSDPRERLREMWRALRKLVKLPGYVFIWPGVQDDVKVITAEVEALGKSL